MKLKLEMMPEMEETEVVIKCANIDSDILRLQQVIAEFMHGKNSFVFFKEDTEFYFSVEEVLFFETEGNKVNAHTSDDVYTVKYKLFELEELLPGHFVRISKSGIVNADKIYSIQRNITAASAIEFQGSHKQIFVSRSYYKVLKNKLEEKR